MNLVFQRLRKGHCNRLQKGGYMARTTRKGKKKVKSRQEKKAKASSKAKSVSKPVKASSW